MGIQALHPRQKAHSLEEGKPPKKGSFMFLRPHLLSMAEQGGQELDGESFQGLTDQSASWGRRPGENSLEPQRGSDQGAM